MNESTHNGKWIRYAFLFAAAILWGLSFVVQAVKEVAPFTFTATRSFIGSIVLVPVFLTMDALRKKRGGVPNLSLEEKKNARLTLLLGGLVCGVVICTAENLQQFGISQNMEPGKAGFITAMYIVLVPVIGLLLGKKSGLFIWISVALGVGGLYLICVKGAFSVNTGDLCLIFCAVAFAVHITVVDYFGNKVDGVKLSCLQFLFCGVFSAIAALIFERDAFSFSVLLAHYKAFLYMGICSCGIAYTFQILGQKGTNPTAASLIMSLEASFSMLFGMLIKGEMLSMREWIGISLMLIAIVFTETKELFFRKRTQNTSD
ncbi:MAG TPA: EamA family transporter [Clostridiales bacterium]|nr:EamA family transporter [Clostridiales bacterium]